jgi:TRAP-type C4-dicarboxylate transport system substrate-binding protein
MLSSLNSDNIQAALLTSAGLSEICPPVMTLSVPFLIRNNNELDTVLREVLPVLDRQMNSTNFTALAWSKGGWVSFFSKEAVLTPDELRRQKLGSSSDLKEINTVFRTMGFQPVETDLVDIGTKLANNVVNSTYLIPEVIAPMGLHRYLTNMLDMPIAPVMGAIVINRVTWNKISREQQTEIVRVTQRLVADFETTMMRTSANALQAMQRDGLKVNRPTQAQEDLWRSEINRAIPMLLGSTFDRALYNQINQILERIRGR